MLEDKILEFFKRYQDKYISGEDLSKTFNISRSAIWKHIEKLREEGYDIIASPHLGYRLLSVPERLTKIELEWQLSTKKIGRTVYSYKELGSTNDTAYNLAMSGEKEGAVVIAEHQTKGRGRLGRKWISPSGKGAYFSIILRPLLLPNQVPVITLLASLAVAKTIREHTGLPAFIKWPNDIVINSRKVCGILTEMNGEMDRINFVILGIGVNINTKKELLPEGATSLAEERGSLINRLEFVRSLFRKLDIYYSDFCNGKIKDILKEYKRYSIILDKHVEVNYHNKTLFGYAIDIDEEGALILRAPSGLNERILAGDVVMLR